MASGFVREALTSDGERHDAGVHHRHPDRRPGPRSCPHPRRAAGRADDRARPGRRRAFSWRWPNGCPAHRSTSSLLHGVDVDPLAVATTRAALSLWAGGDIADTVRVGDHLVDDPFAMKRFDLIVGNPPFLSQLRGGTPRQAQRAALAERWAGVGGYVDDAAAFLLAAVDALADEGTVVLVQPASVLGAVDACSSGTAGPVGTTEGVVGRSWSGLRRRRRHRCARVSGGDAPPTVDVDGVAVARPSAASWAPLLAAAAGVPVVPRPTGGVMLGDVARVTAGFPISTTGLPTPSSTTPPVPIRS